MINRPAIVVWWAIALFALGLGAATLCAKSPCTALPIDGALLQGLHTWQHPGLTALFAVVTWLGSITVLLPAALGLAWYFRKRGHTQVALLLPLAVAGAWLLAHIGKLLIQRPRPELFPPLIAMPADWSFPSAHAMQIAAFGIALAHAPGVRRCGIVVIAMTGAVLMVALSRLYLQVHFPSDVLLGLIAGAAWALGLQALLRTRP